MLELKVDNKIFRYRLAKKEDIDQVMEVIEDGRLNLKLQGHGQWQNGYPNQDTLLNDINNQNLYVICHQDLIVGVLAIIYLDKEYPFVEAGAWASDYNYFVMHRCAVRKEYYHLGLGHFLFQIFEEVAKENGIHSLRIDTHQGNYAMRHILEKNGFVCCGTIILDPNKHRVIYEKVLEY